MKNRGTGDELYHPVGSFNIPSEKDILSQDDLKKGVNTITANEQPHPALETADGKNNGAEPAVFKNQRKART
jgi:hypothetical protein